MMCKIRKITLITLNNKLNIECDFVVTMTYLERDVFKTSFLILDWGNVANFIRTDTAQVIAHLK